jgi:hypothetical protein
MASEQQNEANRLNAQKSTGPRTAEGKARVGSNALKHGLTGKQIVLPNEDPEEFDTFRAGLLNALQPHDELEGSLAERFIIDEWRLRRIPVLEAAVYRRDRRDSIIANQEREVRQYEYTEMSRMMEAGLAFEKIKITDVKAHDEALAKLRDLQSKQLPDPSVGMTILFERHSENLLNLRRHEDGLSRSSSRTLHELQRLKAMRAGEPVSAPAALDVDVNIGGNGTANPE